MALKILFVSHEVAPFAKVGGLADVAGSLPKALKLLGHDVRVIMPAYQMILDEPLNDIADSELTFEVSVSDELRTAELHETTLPNSEVPLYLLATNDWFDKSISSPTVYQPGSEQHAFFSNGVLRACEALEWIPDVVHCNDWQTGMIPVLMNQSKDAEWKQVASVFTIHNLAFQGEFEPEVLQEFGLADSLFNMFQLEAFGSVNFLKAGCTFADHVNTVSPQYAAEIQSAEFGCRLEGLMHHLQDAGRLSGILNGLDYEEFNPDKDPRIEANFSPYALEGKEKCKEALYHELHLAPIPNAPLLGVVSRLSEQKGMDLLLSIADRLFLSPMQVVVQGLGDEWIAQKCRHLADRFPYHFRFAERFDPEFAQRVYAGADMFVMPSKFEPCGLGQLIAMRYGTVPIVRSTGGLANTVADGVTGFVFQAQEPEALLAACRRACFAFGQPDTWQAMMRKAMTHSSDWSKSAQEYSDLYEAIVKAKSLKQIETLAA
ncbi:MAG: glycogen synthase [Fimbriimonadaceae bacterium]